MTLDKRMLHHLQNLEISEKGINYCQETAKNPARRIPGGGRSKKSIFASAKMGVTLQTESDLELAYFLEAEMDDQVFSMWEQSQKIRLTYVRGDGKKQTIWYTPDALEVTIDSVNLVECKREKELIVLSNKDPDRYSYDEQSGTYTSPAMERHLQGTGISFRIVTDAMFNKCRLSNLRFLLDFKKISHPQEKLMGFKNLCTSYLDQKMGVTIADLVNSQKITSDEVFFLIAQGYLFINFDGDKLSEPESCRVFSSLTACQVHTLSNDIDSANLPVFAEVKPLSVGNEYQHGETSWKVLSIDKNSVIISIQINETDSIREMKKAQLEAMVNSGAIQLKSSSYIPDIQTSRISSANESRQKLAVQKFEIIRSHVDGEIPIDEACTRLGKSSRTVRRYKNLYLEGVARRGNGLPELLNNDDLKGNRISTIGPEVDQVAKKVIEENFLDPRNKKVSAVYRDFVAELSTTDFDIPSESWFRRKIKTVELVRTVRSRRGRKESRALLPVASTEGLFENRRGERAFITVDLDSTQTDAVIKLNGENKRPWLTIAVDAYSRAILAVYLSIDPPSRYSVMMLIRELIDRHKRLPESFRVDGGKEFENVEFEQFCAFGSVTIQSRKSNPRGGSAVEGKFKELNDAFIHCLEANTQLTKNPRQMTKEVNPYYSALWTFQELEKQLKWYCYEHYNHTVHPAHKIAPADVIKESLERHGFRNNRVLDLNDQNIQIMMLPYPKSKRTRVIDPVKGVTVGHYCYQHELFQKPEWLGKHVMVRIDPEDNSYVYCNLKGWVRCERVTLEDNYYPNINRETISKVHQASGSFYSPKSRAQRAIPATKRIQETEQKLRSLSKEESTKKATLKGDAVNENGAFTPGQSQIKDF
ncbi:hypothetical protein EOPP23_14790 [Endozoicomonas sp. OPT23]|uniref:Mu transposase C-terminal domain-containing protein n=1 Tax=Endozoicomonas sp. OPT23 TaxID=2072845 RepID=UPI00129BCE50|nr:Mu transposase C-terminal domain-containing protein [Endozoicomonas sp. OPT23]MRI34259.1 hypothetical protein [Endozoicomonas sp. OPT23]